MENKVKVEEGIKQFDVLKQKLGKLRVKQTLMFSKAALIEFCRGFHSPIIGSLEYLKENTSTHSSFQCDATSQQIDSCTITDTASYDRFSKELDIITPPAGVDYTFKLTNGFHPLSDISETFSVYFTMNDYEIVYMYDGNKEFRLKKQYMSYIEPDEIRRLRDLICASITKKAAQEIDSLL